MEALGTLRQTDLKQGVVGCHGERVGVEHQAFGKQREKAVSQHDLRLPPDQGVRKGQRSVVSPN